MDAFYFPSLSIIRRVNEPWIPIISRKREKKRRSILSLNRRQYLFCFSIRHFNQYCVYHFVFSAVIIYAYDIIWHMLIFSCSIASFESPLFSGMRAEHTPIWLQRICFLRVNTSSTDSIENNERKETINYLSSTWKSDIFSFEILVSRLFPPFFLFLLLTHSLFICLFHLNEPTEKKSNNIGVKLESKRNISSIEHTTYAHETHTLLQSTISLLLLNFLMH